MYYTLSTMLLIEKPFRLVMFIVAFAILLMAKDFSSPRRFGGERNRKKS